jgi:hypothetical protein
MFGPSHPYLQPARIEHDLGGAAQHDPIGHRLHVYFGLLWCFSLGLPTSAVEIGSIPLIVYFLLRTPNIWRTWGSFAVQTLTILTAASILWQAMTLLWTPDLASGPERALRQSVGVGDVDALADSGAAALADCGPMCRISGRQSFSGRARTWPATWDRVAHLAAVRDRNSGWWDPVVGGSLLVGALGLHLPAAVMGSGRWRWVGIAGATVTIVAIGATGTRGAWLAAGGLVAVTLAVGTRAGASLAADAQRVHDCDRGGHAGGWRGVDAQG